MKKTVIVCDGCGVEVHEEDAVVEVTEKSKAGLHRKKYDVCTSCLADVKKVFYIANSA